MNNILSVRGLNKEYETFSLRNISFDVPAGYVMGFIGPNGAGKTTTIKSILNMTDFSSGEIELFGTGVSKGELDNEDIGVVMDLPFYVGDWKMKDVEAAISPFYSRWDSAKYWSLIDKFGIEKKKKVRELSRGMKVKLMLAAALSHDARLLILDEPTSGLDPVARDELCTLLGDYMSTEGRSVFFSTHITEDLEKIADYITFIQNGEIVFSGLKDELLEKYFLVKGGPGELGAEHEKLLLGLRRHATGFEAMCEAANIDRLPESLLVEPVSLEEVIIFMNKEGNS